MSGGLRLTPHNSHEVSVDGRRILFHVPTTSLFELDELAADVLDLFRQQPEVTESDLRRRFDGRHPPERVLETLEELLELEVIHNGQPRPANRPPVAIANYPISTLVLNVNTGCNLSCTYCYKEDLTTPDKGQRMAFETAAKSFELLLAEAKERERVNLVFFGGEPLSNMPLIRPMIDYAERRGGRGRQDCRLLAHHQRDAADRGAGRLFQRAPGRHHRLDGRAEGAARPEPQDDRRQGHLRRGREEGAHAAGSATGRGRSAPA